MTDLSSCKTDHLFVLVGGNTLPNYVAIKLLASSDTHIYLVYSKEKRLSSGKTIPGTMRQKKALREALNPDRRPPAYTYLNEVPVDDESSPACIETAIKGQLDKIPKNQSIGLHYTGGTKVMAVHAYLAFRDYQNKSARICYTYLDARLLALWVESSDHGKHSLPIAVGTKCIVPLEDMLKLHNRSDLKEAMRETPYWPTVVQGLANFYGTASKSGCRKWADWCHDNLQARGQDDDKERILKQKLSGLTTADMPQRSDIQSNIYQALEQACGKPFPVSFDTLIQASPFAGSAYPYVNFARWLGGSWLEDYVFMQLDAIKESCLLHSLSMNIKPKIGVSSSGDERDFEFDVACVRGYQLFAFSCTTSADRSRCKSKLLEAAARARQLGGSEARIGLVCCYPDPTDLQNELDALVSENQVCVFGHNDLLNLGEKIRQWIDAVS